MDLGLDGGLSVAMTALPLGGALDFLSHDVHPPLYYTALRVWLDVVGRTPFASKYLGAACGTLALPVLAVWARALVSQRAALIATAILAVAPVAVEASATVREYALALLLIVVAARFNTRGSPWRFAASSALAVWTSYLAFGLVGAAVLDAAIDPLRRRRVPFVLAGSASLAPWLAFAFFNGFGRTLHSVGPREVPIAPSPLPVEAFDLIRLLTGGEFLSPAWLGPALGAGALLLIGLGLARPDQGKGRRGKAGPVVFIAGGFLCSVAIGVATNLTWTRQTLEPRYILPALPFFVVAFAAAVDRSTSRWRVSALATPLIVFAAMLGTAGWLQRPPAPPAYWDPLAMVGYLDQHVGAGGTIVFVSPEQAGYYAALSESPRRWVLVTVGPDYLEGDVPAHARAALSPLVSRTTIFWLVLYHPLLGTGTTQVGDWLSENAYPATTSPLPDTDVDTFLVAHRSFPARAVGTRFREGVTLTSARLPTTIEPGGMIPIELFWRAPGPLPENMSVFVHLVDGHETMWAQHDGWPANGRAPTTHWQGGTTVLDRHGLIVPPDAPPGRYWLEVGLYDANGRLPLQTGGDFVRLGPIVVGEESLP